MRAPLAKAEVLGTLAGLSLRRPPRRPGLAARAEILRKAATPPRPAPRGAASESPGGWRGAQGSPCSAHLRGFTSRACEPGEKDHGPPVGVCAAPPHPVLCGLSPTTQRPPRTHTHKTHRAVAGGSGRVLPATGFRQKPGRGSGGVVVTT